MRAISAILEVISVPLMLLNLLGGVVAGVWLVILGEWGTVGLGIVFFVASTVLLGIALLPSVLLMVPAARFAERGKTAGLIVFGALSSIYVLALITIWCCGVLYLFVNNADAGNLIPKLIWSYGIATGPWVYMASKEEYSSDEGLASFLTTFLAELAYLVIMLLIIFSSLTLLKAIQIFAAFMLVCLLAQTTLTVIMQRESKQIRNPEYTVEDVDQNHTERQ